VCSALRHWWCSGGLHGSKLAPGSQSPEYNTLVVICCNCLFVLVSSVLLLALATAVGASQAQLSQAGFAAFSAVMMMSLRTSQLAGIVRFGTLSNIFFKSKYIPDYIKKKNRGILKDEIVGTGYGMSDNTYINIGKYLVHKNNLLGGKLQVRSPNKNQVYGFKRQNITNNIKDVLLKLNKKEPISFKDVDKLNEQEKNQLYTIGKNYT